MSAVCRAVGLASVWVSLGVPATSQVAGAATSVPTAPSSGSTLPAVVTLQDALRLAKAYSPQFQAAVANAALAKERRLQARDARLPTVTAFNQFLYTEGNGTPSGVFVANDGVHVYNEQAVVRQDLFALVRNGTSLQAAAAEAVAKAQEEIAGRGLVQTVVQDFYNLLAAEHKTVYAQTSLDEAKVFVDITEKQEQAGIVSHVDVVKAELEQEQRARDLEDMQMASDQAHLALAVLLFPRFDQSFTIQETSDDLPALPSLAETQSSAKRDNPDLRSAQASLDEAQAAVTVARYAYLPSLAVNFYYGLDANQLTDVSHNVVGTGQSQLANTVIPNRQNLGYAADVTLNIPLWDWGATRSKVRAAEIATHTAEVNASFAQRQLDASVRAFHEQAELARRQLDSLERSRDLAKENLHLTTLRYEAGQATALEVVTAEDSLALARNAYEDGRNRFYITLAQIQTLTGSL